MARYFERTLPPSAAPIRIKDILHGIAGLFGGGKAVKRFEDELKENFRVRHCHLVSSGKAALVVILRALKDISPERDEVLVPAYSCYSVPSAVVRAGLKVRLCDLAPGSLDFDPASFEEELANPRLLCVIPTHLFGVPADVERVKRSVRHRGIFVVEDTAQAMGARWYGRKLGTQGDVGLFSLGRGKSYTTVEGGIILTNSDLIGNAIRKQIGSLPGYDAFGCLKLILYAVALSALIQPRVYWLPKALPFLRLGETRFDTSFPIKKLSPFQAGMAKEWQTQICSLQEARLNNVKDIAGHGITSPGMQWDSIPDLIRFPVVMASADAKKKFFRMAKVWGWGYPPDTPIHLME
jgi:hypothetical protein